MSKYAPAPAGPEDDLKVFCMPDFAACSPAVADIGPAFTDAIQWLTGKEWLNSEVTGTKEFIQNPVYMFWTNVNLMVGTCCVPCCMCATNARAMSKMTGRTCESEMLICCALNCIGCYPCYKAKTHHDLRKKYGIKGAPAFDCAASCCLGSCLMCQEVVELQAMGQMHVPFCNVPVGGAAAPAAATAAPVPVAAPTAAAEPAAKPAPESPPAPVEAVIKAAPPS